MPDVFLPSSAGMGTASKPVSGSVSSGGGTAKKPVSGLKNQPGGAPLATLGYQGLSGAPLGQWSLRAAALPFSTAPLLLPRGPLARRVSGLIWPRQFVGMRPDTGVLIPRLRGAGAVTSGAALLTESGDALTTEAGERLIF